MTHIRRVGGICNQTVKSPYALEVLADSPKVYWEYQDCKALPRDFSGNDLHMTALAGGTTGTVYRETGPLTTPNDRSILQAGGKIFSRSVASTVRSAWTMEMWLKISSATNFPQEVFYNGNGGLNGYGIRITSAMKMRMLFGGLGDPTPSTTTLSVGVWYHIACTFGSGTGTFYLNGSADGTFGAVNPNTPTGTTYVGGSSIQRWQAHIALYESTLSSTRIAAHYAAR